MSKKKMVDVTIASKNITVFGKDGKVKTEGDTVKIPEDVLKHRIHRKNFRVNIPPKKKEPDKKDKKDE